MFFNKEKRAASKAYLEQSKADFILLHNKICDGNLVELTGRIRGTHVRCSKCDSFWANGNKGLDLFLMKKFIREH